MILDITEPQDTVLMSNFHTYFQDAKTQIAERMEAQSSPGIYEHGQRTSSDFGKHSYGTQFALIHSTLADLTALADKVNGSLHVVLESDSLYTINDGSLVHLSFLDHATLDNLDGTVHDGHYYRKDSPVQLDEDAIISDGGEVILVAQSYIEDSDPLEPSHVEKTHLEAHGSGSLDLDSIPSDSQVANSTSGAYYSISGFQPFQWNDDGSDSPLYVPNISVGVYYFASDEGTLLGLRTSLAYKFRDATYILGE